MSIPYIRGRVATQAHVALPEGTHEEEYARNGFFGRYAHLYREHAPVAWTRIEGPLRPRLYDLAAAESITDYLAARTPLLANADCKIHIATFATEMHYFFRNADGDELLFVHTGAGRLETDFGPLAYEPGDYIVIPRGTLYRFAPTSETRLLVVETTGEIALPDRGMLGQHALFDPAVLRVPAPEASALTSGQGGSRPGEWRVAIQRQGALTSVYYPHCPLDVVGWKGTLSVWQLNVRDIRPVSSDRYHLPPSAHTTFIAPNVAICTFAPRPLENGDPRALKVPFYHSNIDFDEVLFYHAGEFFSRDGVRAGMLTFHPQGIHHGPQAKASARAPSAQRTEEIAVMIDTRRPLDVCAQATPLELPDYWRSWQPENAR